MQHSSYSPGGGADKAVFFHFETPEFLVVTGQNRTGNRTGFFHSDRMKAESAEKRLGHNAFTQNKILLHLSQT